MAKSCKMFPTVKVDGVIKESKLFKSLLSYFAGNRLNAIHIWNRTRSEEFKNHPVYSKLSFDENGEPTLDSLINVAHLDNAVNMAQLVEDINKEIGYYKRGSKELKLYVDNNKNYYMLFDKALKFNTTSPHRNKVSVKVIRVQKGDHVLIAIRAFDNTSGKYSLETEKGIANYKLNQVLNNILSANGIAVDALTDLEERMGINGVADFDQAQRAADGLIHLIRLAKGEKGEKALPEEFAHFALRAMKDQPLAERLIDFIDKKGLVKEILGDSYEDYKIKYNNNPKLLAEEAAGKLLAQHLNSEFNKQEVKPYTNLLSRFINLLKNFFSKFNEDSIKRAKVEADSQMSELAKNILKNKVEYNVDTIKMGNRLLQIGNRAETLKEAAIKMSDNAKKRLKIYENRTKNSEFSEKQKEYITQLDINIEKENYKQAIADVLTYSVDVMNQLKTKLESLNTKEDMSLQERAALLRDIRNYIYANAEVLDTAQKQYILNKDSEDDSLEELKEMINELTILNSDLKGMLDVATKDVVVKMFEPFIGEGITYHTGKYKGHTFTIDEVMHFVQKDISWADRFLDSAADSESLVIKIFDQIIKEAKNKARLEAIEDSKELKAAQIELEKAGIKDTDWMYARDENGKLTGYYISEIDYTKYKLAKQKAFDELKEEYGIGTPSEDITGYSRAKYNWINDNTIMTEDGKRTPDINKYHNDNFPVEGSAQRKYYDTFIKFMTKYNNMLPEGTMRPNSIIKIRKSLIERVKDSDSIKSGGKQIFEAVKDAWLRRSDDIDMGVSNSMQDFEGYEVQTLPLYYTSLRKGEDINDMSTDATSTLISFASMALDYNEMNKVIDGLELTRSYLRDNLEVQESKANNPVVEEFKSLGKKVTRPLIKSKSKLLDRLDDLMTMQGYGRYMKDEGDLFGIPIAKLANNINTLTSINMIGLNLLGGISNISTGSVMMRIESFAGEFFNEKDTIYADKEYGANLPSYVAEIGKRVKTNKLSLFDELFDVLQDYEQEIKDSDMNMRTRFTKLFGTGLLFSMNNAGEHWMQNRTALALAHRYKMLDDKGNETNLWKALEVRYIDPNNKDKGAKLVIKDGYTKLDGSQFTKEDIYKFTRKSAAINQRMHGTYNKLDRSAIQQYAVGRMAILFRKWMRDSFNRRFQASTYNMDLEQETQGYYNTVFEFVARGIKELKQGQYNWITNYKNLSEHEKRNFRRALTETGHILALLAIISLWDWDDKKNRPWYKKMLEYQTYRLYSELSSMSVTPQMPRELIKIVNSPAAGVTTINSMLGLMSLFNPYNYEFMGGKDALMKSGHYKGHSKAYKILFESPLVPMNKNFRNAIDQEDATNYFKQGLM